MNLWSYFLDNNKEVIHKCTHYFPVYERLFQGWQNKSLVFLEIGVSEGGSLKMWHKYFGSSAKIIGIDINPEYKKYESPGIFVRIGDQSNHEFLASVVEEFGVPDIVLDDGSHRCTDIMRSFSFFYPLMNKNAIYVVEDLQTAYWEQYGGGLYHPDSFIEFVKRCIDSLNADSSRGQVKPDIISGQAFEHIEFFWKIMEEITRVCKKNGLICIIAPSEVVEHRYPIDCYRFYMDGMIALARYVCIEPLHAHTNCAPFDTSENWLVDNCMDSMLVARKPYFGVTIHPDFNEYVFIPIIQEHYRSDLIQKQSLLQNLQSTQQELAQTRSQLQSTQQELAQTKNEISLMQKSKFWKMRNLWFKIKSRIASFIHR